MVHYRFVGGKGGVGKTTCAAAYAVASAREGRRTLLISTDPAPSAGDALRQPLGAAPTRVRGTRDRLDALEVDAAKALARWLRPRRPLLETIALRGTWLDEDDVSTLLRLSLPGIDEIAAIMEVGRLGRTGRYDLVVVDTAPTGHTLHMLAMPDLLRRLAGVFDHMQSKHREIVGALRGRWSPDEADALVTSLDREGHDLRMLLRDRGRTALTWVTLPEPMAVAETADGLEELRALGMCVDTVVVNRLTPPPDRECAWCRATRRVERDAVDALLAGRERPWRVATVSARPREPRGAAALAAVAAELHAAPRLQKPRGAPRPRIAGARTPARAPAPLPGEERASLLMFGGKGGVGKTTCAAAAALAAAARNPGRAVLLLSSDPAHSLADALGVDLDDQPRPVRGAPPNFTARELDARASFLRLKERYWIAIDALFDRVDRGSSVDATADRQAMRDLIDLAPPGLDELMAMVAVSDALEPWSERMVVLDTAPSGHALRLLEMPALVHAWVKALMGIVLKYQPVAGIGDVGAVLLQMSQGLGRLRGLLADPSRAAFIAVTRPAALPVAETARLVKRLRRLDVHVPAVLVNALGAGTCGYCAALARQQRRALASIRRAFRGPGVQTIVLGPAVVPPPHGPEALRRWRDAWIADGARTARAISS